ncbi:hypothetical protein ACI65C_006403 [Semiaphis heraclei]
MVAISKRTKLIFCMSVHTRLTGRYDPFKKYYEKITEYEEPNFKLFEKQIMSYTNYPLIDLEMWHIRHINLSSELFKMKLIDEDEDDMFEAIHNNVDKMVKFPFHSVPDVNL